MVSRPSVNLSRLLVAGAITLAFTQPLRAQDPPRVIVRGDGAFNIINGVSLTLSDAAVRSLIETNLPEALLGDSARHIVLVVDANDRYVSGKVTNAKVISLSGEDGVGLHRIVVGDSIVAGAANVVVIRRDGPTTTPVTVDGLPIALSLFSKSSGESSDGVFGSGYSMSDVASIGMRRYAPGQFGAANIIVSIVRLK